MSEHAPPPAAKGLASSSNPGWLARRATSIVMRRLGSARVRDAKRRRAERRRQRAGEPHRIEYFHQVDDPYSHLAAQLLERLCTTYDIELVPRLSARESGDNAPEPELLAAYARRDAADVARSYGLSFPAHAQAPTQDHVLLAERILAAADPRDFGDRAMSVGRSLWSEDKDGLAALARDLPIADESATRDLTESGKQRRIKLGHYSGAMFYYAGEWYWGVDRLCHLEPRLVELGALRDAASAPIAVRPEVDPGPTRDTGRIALEYFPSLRSPYTGGSYDLATSLAERSGVKLVLRPVLPMVMRGAPVTFRKGRYIFSDAHREAELAGVPFGNVIDPIGRPVLRAFSLFPWARERGRATEFLSSFLSAAFAQGVDTSTDAGLRHVVVAAGLSWQEAEERVDNDDWQDEIEANRLVMYDELGLWGVPSFRVTGPEGSGEPDFSVWGQDRLWRVAQEIRRRIAL